MFTVSQEWDPLTNEVAGFEERLLIEHLIIPTEDDGSDVLARLTADEKKVPSRYLYDDIGTQIFEEICQLPEYYLTRTETLILKENAKSIATITGHCEFVELGSGSSIKTAIFLDAYQKLNLPILYCPIDVCEEVLVHVICCHATRHSEYMLWWLPMNWV